MSEELETTKEIVAEALEVISPSADDSPKRRASPKAEKPAATAKYLVINGAIAPNGGGRADLVQPGSVVELTAAQAKHYNNMGYLKPYIED